jgi:hypothetical protein
VDHSPPLTAKQLKGKVGLVDFWTYSCRTGQWDEITVQKSDSDVKFA